MKALAILNDMKLKYNSHYIEGSDQVIKLDEAIDELEQVLTKKKPYQKSMYNLQDFILKLTDVTVALQVELVTGVLIKNAINIKYQKLILNIKGK